MTSINEKSTDTKLRPVGRSERLVSNVLYLTAAHFLIAIFGLAATMIITRFLGPIHYGNLSLAYAYLGLFSTLVEASLNLTITREASQNITRMGKLIGQGILIQGLLAVVGYGIATLILPLLGFEADVVRLFRIALFFLFLSPFTLFRLIFLVTQKIKLVAILDVINHLLKTAFVLSIIVFSLGHVAEILIMQLAAHLVAVLLYYIYGRSLLADPISLKFNWQLTKQLLGYAWPLFVAAVLFTLQIHLGRLIIGMMLTRQEVGFFAVVSNLVTALSFVPTIYFTSVYPLLAQYHVADPGYFRSLYRFSFKSMMAVSMPVSLLAYLTGERIITLYAGVDYQMATPLFTLLIWTLPLNFAGSVFYFVILAAGKQAVLPKVSIARVSLYLVLLILCLYTIGYLGIGVAAIGMYLFTFMLFGLLISTRDYLRDWLSAMVRPLLATLILYLLWQLTYPSSLITWVIGLPLYGVILLTLGGITHKEIEIVKNLWLNWRYS